MGHDCQELKHLEFDIHGCVFAIEGEVQKDQFKHSLVYCRGAEQPIVFFSSLMSSSKINNSEILIFPKSRESSSCTSIFWPLAYKCYLFPYLLEFMYKHEYVYVHIYMYVHKIEK